MDFDQTSITQIYSKRGNLIGLKRNHLSESLVHTSMRDISEFMVDPGTFSQTEIKIIDTSKRAFDTSVESTRALELAL